MERCFPNPALVKTDEPNRQQVIIPGCLLYWNVTVRGGEKKKEGRKTCSGAFCLTSWEAETSDWTPF